MPCTYLPQLYDKVHEVQHLLLIESPAGAQPRKEVGQRDLLLDGAVQRLLARVQAAGDDHLVEGEGWGERGEGTGMKGEGGGMRRKGGG